MQEQEVETRETKIEGGQGIVGINGGENRQPEFTSLLCNLKIGRNTLDTFFLFPFVQFPGIIISSTYHSSWG